MITENISTLKIHKLTQEQYDRELAAGNIDENALYLTPYGAGADEYLPLTGGTVTGATTFEDTITIGEATLRYDGATNSLVFSL